VTLVGQEMQMRIIFSPDYRRYFRLRGFRRGISRNAVISPRERRMLRGRFEGKTRVNL